MAVKEKALGRVLAFVLMVITVSLFSYWGYQWVNYVLGQVFHVDTGSSFYDLFIGLIAMIASVPLFIGSVYVFLRKPAAVSLLTWGVIGFFIKNLLDIINDIYPLMHLATITAEDISNASWMIGFEFLQLAFWIFVLVYFTRKWKKPA